MYRNPKNYTSDQLCAMETEEFLRYCHARVFKTDTGQIVVYETLDCSGMGLEKLPDLSQVVVRHGFNCSDNRLKDLAGAPQSVGAFFDCSCNQLTSLTGAPEKVGGFFSCKNNKLISLEGGPTSVSSFYCEDNPLTSFDGIPAQVKHSMFFDDNQIPVLIASLDQHGFDGVRTSIYDKEDTPRLSAETCKLLADAMTEKKYQDSHKKSVDILKNPLKFKLKR